MAGAEQPAVAAAGAPVLDKERRLRILVAEDMLDNRILLQLYLRDYPYEVEMVEDGLQATGRFMGASYDLILMDVQMPVMDGYEATRAIRQFERQQGRLATPIIALTAHALREEVANSLAAGCTAHLTKPVRKQDLLDAIALHTQGSAPVNTLLTPTRETRIVIEFDKDLADLIPDYLERRRQDLANMRNALDRGDLDMIRIQGHSMKGSGASYGFVGLTEIGGALEQAAQRGDGDAVRQLVGELTSYLDRVEIQAASEPQSSESPQAPASKA